MDEDRNLDYNLELETELSKPNKWPKVAKILLGIFIVIIILSIAGILTVYFIYNNKLKESSSGKSNPDIKPNPEPTPTPPMPNVDTYIFFGEKLSNLTYDVNGKIENSFKATGDNYEPDIGDLNGGEDYNKTDRNIYDLYIPQYALDRKKEVNGILLWIHGGAWIEGNKEQLDIMCKLFSAQGYISATVGYTLLGDKYQYNNIYRIIDEITACIKAIKNKLKDYGFDESKLLLSIGGHSAGAHLALLYSYLVKNFDIIPIKFVMDFAGPIGLKKEYFYQLKSVNDTLPNIEDVSVIEEALKNGQIVSSLNELNILLLMNYFYGNKFTQKELNLMLLDNKTINIENEKYKEMYKFVKHAYVTEIEDKHHLPTICMYGGEDTLLGVSSFAYLKQKMIQDNRPYDFIYTRYEGHSLIITNKEAGKEKTRETSSKIMNYCRTYFGY